MNKRKLFISIAIAVIVLVVSYVFYQKAYGMEAIQTYKPTYIIAGDKIDQVKYQVSFKYALISPFNSGIYFSYTQISKWNIYDQSSPFRESNYNPSIFWEKQKLWIFDVLRISPYSHQSNGLDKERSRSLETGFAQAQISYGDKLNIGINETGTWHYSVANKNKDYKRYKGFFRTELFLQLKGNGKYFDQEKIYVSGEWTHKSYWIESGIAIRLLTAQIRPKIYIQWYYGTAEFLENYREKTNALRAGLIFNPE
jgi:phospholipase A1/A2